MYNPVELSAICPDVLFDIRYAAEKSFAKKAVYQFPVCYLQKKA